jgi:type VI secretion system protein ImpC
VLSILVIADASGRAARGVKEPLAGREPGRLDLDHIDGLLNGFRARVPTPLLDAAGAPYVLEPRSLEELHPDHLLENVPALRDLFTAWKRRDRDPDAAGKLATLLQRPAVSESVPAAAASSSSAPSAPGAPASAESGDDTLARLLGGARSASPQSAAPSASAPARPASSAKPDINRLISAIVGNALPPAKTPVDPGLAAAAEVELGRRLRSLLADPGVRALEATWRGIDGLCRSCPDEERIQLKVLDASWAEVAADLAALDSLIRRRKPDVILLDHQFGADAAELQQLSSLLTVCNTYGVMLLAAGRPELAGCSHFRETEDPHDNEIALGERARTAWLEIQRQRAGGAQLALSTPRFMLRQPYGGSGEPIEGFAFEEVLDSADHDAFPWGNGAYLLARVVGILHTEGDRAAHPDGSVDLREIPIVHLDDQEETRIKPTAEAWLSERALGRLRVGGFSVLAGVRDTDRIRVYL